MVARAWDLAATAATGGNDPDWTTGVKLARDDLAVSLCWMSVGHARHATRSGDCHCGSRTDGRQIRHNRTAGRPGQAGKHQANYFARRLAGYRISIVAETGSK